MEKNKQKEIYEKLNGTNTLPEIQEYISKINEIRGFNKQEITQTMLLLTEEIGELAKAVRKSATNMKTDENKQYNYDTVESEIADVFYVLCSICNSLNIDIFSCLKEKEEKNINRKWK